MMEIDFSLGHWRHKPNATLETAGGDMITSTVAFRNGLGDRFVGRNAKFFKGCGCKKDIVPVMNRWDVNTVTEKQIERVAKTLEHKNEAKLTLEQSVALLTEFIAEEKDDEN